MKNAIPATGLIALAVLLVCWTQPVFGQIPPKPPVVKVQKPPQPNTPMPLKPDLVITSCSITPSTIVQGVNQTVSLSLEFENKGLANAVIQSHMMIWMSTPASAAPGFGGGQMNTGAAYNIVTREKARGGLNNSHLDTLAPGTYVLTFTVDPNNWVEEGNETNNQMTCTLTVTPGAFDADLVISALAFEPLQPLSTAAFNLRVTVRNQGTTPAIIPQYTKMLTAGPYGVDISEYSDLTLAPGGTRSYLIGPTRQGTQRGDWTWTVVVDPDNRVRERDDANNQSTIAVTVR